ncbi:hypothetical protein KO116_03576 [Halomonas sp. KO116]|nr:hypothetical protein KO116_03576 [Halomonas sp. KO116]
MEPVPLVAGITMPHNGVVLPPADISRCNKTSEKEISHAHPNSPCWRNPDDR